MSPTITTTTTTKSKIHVEDKCPVRIGKINTVSGLRRSTDKSMLASSDEILFFMDRYGDLDLSAVVTRWPRSGRQGLGLRYVYPELPMSIIRVLTDVHAIVQKRVVNGRSRALHCSPPPADFGKAFSDTKPLANLTLRMDMSEEDFFRMLKNEVIPVSLVKTLNKGKATVMVEITIV